MRSTFINSQKGKLSAVALAFAFAFTSCSTDEEFKVQDELSLNDQNGQVIAGSYIVVLKDNITDGSALRMLPDYDAKQALMREIATAILREGGADIKAERVYSDALLGFSANLSQDVVNRLRSDDRVAYIEEDRIMTLAKPNNDVNQNASSQVTPYGITRVGGAVDGTGKTAWVIDTGIELDHPDLNVDGSRGFTAFTRGRDGKDSNDLNGHGTHVAGTIAAIDNDFGVVGVAANATVVGVKVLDSRGSGSYAGVIAGVDYVGAKAKAGDVANMSLGGPPSTALDDAVKNAAAKGIYFTLAAGNSADDAKDYSPARATGDFIYTISAMDSNDNWASFSNFGNPPVDFCQPGVGVNSTWINNSYRSISGTSMALPHAAGVLLVSGGSIATDGTVNNDPDGNPDPILVHR